MVVNIHSGYFAQPGPFPYGDDLTCSTGEVLDTFFLVSQNGIPSGLISRTEYDPIYATHLQAANVWAAEIDTILQQTPLVVVDHINNYNSGTNTINTIVYTQALSSLNGDYYLSVFLTEDGIISAMKNETGVDTNHVNNNLLRAGINGNWGTLISSGAFTAGSIITNNFSFVMDPSWVLSNCKIVCFVYDNATKEVLQVTQKALLDNSSSPLSLNELKEENSFDIFPNPFTTQTRLVFKEEQRNAVVRIVNVLGAEVKRIRFSGKELLVDKGEMNKGVYFIQVIDGEMNVLNKKVVVQ